MSGEKITSFTEDDGVMAVSIGENNVFCGLESKVLHKRQLQHENHIAKYQGHQSMVWCVAASSNSKRVASGSADETVKLWDVESHECLYTFKGHKDHVTAVYANHDGRILVSGGGYIDKTIRIWDTEKEECICSFKGHDSAITDVAIIDQNTVISCSEDKTIRIWDVPDRQCQKVISGIAKVGQWVRKQPFYAVMRDTESVVVEKESGREIVALPMVIEQIDLTENSIISGKTSDYLYVLKLHA